MAMVSDPAQSRENGGEFCMAYRNMVSPTPPIGVTALLDTAAAAE